MRILYIVPLTLCLAGSALAQGLQDAFPDLSFAAPTDIQAPDDGSNRLFVAEQRGTIRVFENTPSVASGSAFLDITDRVHVGGGLGLLGFVFDPAYALNGQVYVHYSRVHPDDGDPDPFQSVIARFSVTAGDPDLADAGSEEVLLIVDQPVGQHNGGQLQFGPDGYLYVSLGDGGGQNDPFGNGQDVTNLNGTLLRLDVRGTGGPLDCAAGTGAATVPAGNPLADGPGGVCDELWAYGFRNPWRFSFGPDGRLWLADVGQNAREEIDLVVPGGNYGWSTYEGTRCNAASGCNPAGLLFPIYEYNHSFAPNGGFSITGGYVYTGNTCAPLLGRYVYGDYVTGNVWSLTYDGQAADNAVVAALTGRLITTFGRDEQGEVYLADAATGGVSSFQCEQPVAVSVAPVGAPVVIPSGGGTVAFDVTLTNTTATAQPFDAWADADLSTGAERRVIAPVSATLPAGATVTRRVTLSVPGAAPAGTSTLVVKVGAFPDVSSSAGRFTVTKQATSAATASVPAAWQADGWRFATEAAALRAGRAEHAALRVYPSPFSSRATVAYTLPHAVPVQLTVYDVLGREVARLVDGEAEAGRHEAVLDGAGLPSGIYLVRLAAGGVAQTQQVTLVR